MACGRVAYGRVEPGRLVARDAQTAVAWRAAQQVEEGVAVVVVEPAVEQRVDTRRALRHSPQHRVHELEVLSGDELVFEVGEESVEVVGGPGGEEDEYDGDQHARRVRLAPGAAGDASGDAPQHTPVEDGREAEGQGVLHPQGGHPVHGAQARRRPPLDAVPSVQAQQAVVDDGVAREDGDGQRDDDGEDGDDDDTDERVRHRHAAAQWVEDEHVAVDGDHGEAERRGVHDDGEDEGDEAAEGRAERPVVRQLVVGGERKVDSAHDHVGQSEVDDEDVRRCPHLPRLRHRHHHQRVADHPGDDDDRVEDDDDGGKASVSQHVEVVGTRQRVQRL